MTRLDRIAAERLKRARLRREIAECPSSLDEADRKHLEAYIGYMKHALRWASKRAQ